MEGTDSTSSSCIPSTTIARTAQVSTSPPLRFAPIFSRRSDKHRMQLTASKSCMGMISSRSAVASAEVRLQWRAKARQSTHP